MSKIGTAEVKRLAALARIELSDEEVTKLAVELGQIVDLVTRLQGVDVSKIDPTNQVTGLSDVWREDEVVPSRVSTDELLKNAPMQQDGYIKVRRVLKQ
jgi:aspartyl-tRNA(Asn)/glutamyl-tRNA(Gln) amidotransferase subunit C